MGGLLGWVRHAPLVTFTVLSYLLSWWPVLLPGGGLLPHGPAVAAVLVLAATEGRRGVRSWWQTMLRPGRSARWYLLAAVVPASLALGAGGLTVALGAPVPAHIDWTDPIVALPLMLLLSGMWEEPGWTGYALPRLAARFGPAPAAAMAAIAVTAAMRTDWHVPLVLTGALPWGELLFIVAFQFALAGLFLGSGSVLPVMLVHLVSNTVGGQFVWTWFAGADRVTDSWVRTLLWSLLALGLVLGPCRRRTGAPRRAPEGQ